MSQFILRVHHDRSPPSNRFLNRITGHQQKPSALVAGFNPNRIPLVKQHQRTVSCKLLTVIHGIFHANVLRIRSITKSNRSGNDVGERMPRCFNGNRTSRIGGQADIQITGLGGDTLDGPDFPQKSPHSTRTLVPSSSTTVGTFLDWTSAAVVKKSFTTEGLPNPYSTMSPTCIAHSMKKATDRLADDAECIRRDTGVCFTAIHKTHKQRTQVGLRCCILTNRQFGCVFQSRIGFPMVVHQH